MNPVHALPPHFLKNYSNNILSSTSESCELSSSSRVSPTKTQYAFFFSPAIDHCNKCWQNVDTTKAPLYVVTAIPLLPPPLLGPESPLTNLFSNILSPLFHCFSGLIFTSIWNTEGTATRFAQNNTLMSLEVVIAIISEDHTKWVIKQWAKLTFVNFKRFVIMHCWFLVINNQQVYLQMCKFIML